MSSGLRSQGLKTFRAEKCYFDTWFGSYHLAEESIINLKMKDVVFMFCREL